MKLEVRAPAGMSGCQPWKFQASPAMVVIGGPAGFMLGMSKQKRVVDGQLQVPDSATVAGNLKAWSHAAPFARASKETHRIRRFLRACTSS